MSTLLSEWLSNDPTPGKTIDLVKGKINRAKMLSANNPVQLMRERLTPAEFNNFWADKKMLEDDFTINDGWSGDKSVKISWHVPQVVVNANPEHWQEVFMKKEYTKYPYFLLGSPISGVNSINVTSNFKA